MDCSAESATPPAGRRATAHASGSPPRRTPSTSAGNRTLPETPHEAPAKASSGRVQPQPAAIASYALFRQGTRPCPGQRDLSCLRRCLTKDTQNLALKFPKFNRHYLPPRMQYQIHAHRQHIQMHPHRSTHPPLDPVPLVRLAQNLAHGQPNPWRLARSNRS